MGQMYPGTPQSPGPHQAAQPYVVIVEEKNRRNVSWHISLVQPVGGLAEARAAGQNIAFQHQPETAGHKVGRRDVYHLGEDSWLIAYDAPWRLGGPGHFRVSVARHIGSAG